MRTRLTLFIGLTALVSGCAAPKQVTFWTEKSGLVSVHHITGSIDQIEKLTTKESDVENIPDGQKGFQVSTSSVNVLPKAKANGTPTKKGSNSGGSKLAEVTRKLEDLRTQVKSVAAENQRLASQISASSAPEQQPVPQEPAAPRMSQ